MGFTIAFEFQFQYGAIISSLLLMLKFGDEKFQFQYGAIIS